MRRLWVGYVLPAPIGNVNRAGAIAPAFYAALCFFKPTLLISVVANSKREMNMQHKLSRRTLDISCLEDLCEPSELISGVEYRYNVDGELEFLGFDSDREAFDTEFYDCIGDGKVNNRLRQIRDNRNESKQAFILARAKAREEKERRREEARIKAQADLVAKKKRERLTAILKRDPTVFEESFYTPVETVTGWALMFELVVRTPRGYEDRFVNYAHGRGGLPRLYSQFDMIVALMRTVTAKVVFCNINTNESFVEEYSFSNRESVEQILKPASLKPSCWGALLMGEANLCRLAVLKETEVETRNFQYVNALTGIWQASAHFTRTDNYVKRAIEFSDVRYAGPKTLALSS